MEREKAGGRKGMGSRCGALVAGMMLTAGLVWGEGEGTGGLPMEAETRIERVAAGLGFTEGPLWDGDGLLFTDIPNNRIMRLDVESGLTQVWLEGTAGMNGLGLGADGRVIAAQHEGRQVVAIDRETKAVEVLVDRYEGKRFNTPNDVWIDAKGGVYFTDPAYWPREKPMELGGEYVFHVAPGGGEVRCVDEEGMRHPNGLVGTPDGGRLYVSAHGGGWTYVYDVEADGGLSNRRGFVEIGSDGMALDEAGNLYLTPRRVRAVVVVSREGERLGAIELPEYPANVCFGGEDGRTLFVTAQRSVYAVKMQVRGAAWGE